MTRDAQKLRLQAERGRRADEIMNDPMVTEAFDNIEKVIDNAWKDSSSGDRDARDNAYLLYRILKRFRGHFRAILVNGNNARALLQAEEAKGATDA